ncbi:MAG: DUF2933 domain-containing protein [Betaproteobacteria bacterium]|nr:DUF2933 domain-containing protein [Betaproteobacteria bacterium]
MSNEQQSQGSPDQGPPNSRLKWALIGFLAIAGFFLFTEHTAHVLGVLPYLLLLACPLLHFFMHGSHGGHGDHEGPAGKSKGEKQ